MTLAPKYALSLDAKFDELNLVDCVSCNNKACVRIVKSWSSQTFKGFAMVKWECSICHNRRFEQVKEVQAVELGPKEKDRLGTCPRCTFEHQPLFDYSASPIPTESRFCIRCISKMNNLRFNSNSFSHLLPDPEEAPIASAGVVKASKEMSCGLCTLNCSELHSVGEIWVCQDCLEVCDTLGDEEREQLNHLKSILG